MMIAVWFRSSILPDIGASSPPDGRAKRGRRGLRADFSATEVGLQRRVYAVDLQGKLRLSYRAPGGVTLEDIAPDGRFLLTRDEQRAGSIGLASGAARERDNSWLDWSLPVDLNADGKTVVFDEDGEQSGFLSVSGSRAKIRRAMQPLCIQWMVGSRDQSFV
jgi:hypothetical protein